MRACRKCNQLMNEWRERCPACGSRSSYSLNERLDHSWSEYTLIVAVALATVLLVIGGMLL